MNETAAAAGVISNMTTSHWTDDFDADVRAVLVSLEVVEWISLLTSLFGMYFGIEIGHPGKFHDRSKFEF